MDGTTPFIDGTLDSATLGIRRSVPGEVRADPFDLPAFLSTTREGQNVAFAAKQPIFKQGDAADALYYILNGRAQLTAVSEHGRQGVLALFGIGDFIGEGCLSGQNMRPGSAITMTPVTAIKISRAAVPRLMQSEPRFMETLMQILSARVVHYETELADHLLMSGEQRLARTLLSLAGLGEDGYVRRPIAKIPQDVLAAKVGTTRSRINQFMTKFRKLGLINYDASAAGKIEVHGQLMSVIDAE